MPEAEFHNMHARCCHKMSLRERIPPTQDSALWREGCYSQPERKQQLKSCAPVYFALVGGGHRVSPVLFSEKCMTVISSAFLF